MRLPKGFYIREGFADMNISPDTPRFSLTLRGEPATLSLSGRYDKYMTIHHHADPVANPDGKAVTFDSSCPDRFALVQHTQHGPEELEEGFVCGFPSFPDEDQKISVGKSDTFVSLLPGESHTTGPINFYPHHDYDEEFELGERYQYQYIGGEIKWWDWGTKEVC